MNENLDPSKINLSQEDIEVDKALRPLSFSDFKGQKQTGPSHRKQGRRNDWRFSYLVKR